MGINTILLSPGDEAINSQQVKEAIADEVFTPGNLLERTATGVQKHSTSNGRAQKIFALENVADARGIDDDYVAGETSRFWFARSGDEIYALVANGTAAIAQNAALASNGDGTLVTVTDTANDAPLDQVVVAYALEAVDNSGGSEPARIRVEVA